MNAVHVCMQSCVYVCMCAGVHVWTHAWHSACVYVIMRVTMHACVFIRLQLFVFRNMHVCLYIVGPHTCVGAVVARMMLSMTDNVAKDNGMPTPVAMIRAMNKLLMQFKDMNLADVTSDDLLRMKVVVLHALISAIPHQPRKVNYSRHKLKLYRPVPISSDRPDCPPPNTK
jgi:hypothetical protein